MFIHLVLVRIKKKDVPVYKADCRMWKKEAARHAGYLDCHMLMRTNKPGQYASTYLWKDQAAHKRFMARHHDRLVSLSHCPVAVLGYYDFKAL